jgi:hypothetical protein
MLEEQSTFSLSWKRAFWKVTVLHGDTYIYNEKRHQVGTFTRESPTARSGDLALCELQVPLARWVAACKGRFLQSRDGWQDSLAAMVGNLSKSRKPRINALVLQDKEFCNRLATWSSKERVTHNPQGFFSLRTERANKLNPRRWWPW